MSAQNEERRWPLSSRIVFIVGGSFLLWALIVGGSFLLWALIAVGIGFLLGHA